MSYIRPMGDGPITHPSEVDDSIDGGVVPPTRVPCSELPADSPFKRPGGPCSPEGQPWWEAIKDTFFPTVTDPDPPPGTPSQYVDVTLPVLLVAAGGLTYYLLKKKR